MKSINDIRRDNMRKLVELHCEGKLKTFEAKVGLSQGQASHLNTGFRNIGDNIALRIENAFSLPTGWMDTDQDAEISPSLNESHAAYGALSPELEELLAAAKAAMNSGSITKDSILSMINLLRSLPQPSNELKTTPGKMQAHFAKARKSAPR